MISNTNSVSMAIRADRFNEREADDKNKENVIKSHNFELLQYKYILRAINFFNKNIKNPTFFLYFLIIQKK